ncbi:MAG: carboxypeptidase regulatory-like domain-containing protein, partial [Polyangiaceae bacterium]
FDGAHGGANFPDARAFWNDISQMNQYDIIVYSCEGKAFDSDKTASGVPNTEDFVNRGGKMFASHWHRGFFSLDPQLSTIGTWSDENDPTPNPSNGTVVQSFPKGAALAQWLQAVGASTTLGTIAIGDPRENVYSIVSPGTEWVYLDKGSSPKQHVPEFTTVNTPVGASDDKLCGKAAFSDLHVSAGGTADQTGVDWPSGCAAGDLSAQEKALEFLFFDLSACVQNDNNPPPPPR